MVTDRASGGLGRTDDELAMVRMMIERQDYAGARRLARRLLNDRPDNAAVRAVLGDLSAAQGQWTEAVNWYEQSLEMEFDATMMEKLAAARARAIETGTGPESGPEIPLVVSRPTVSATTSRERRQRGMLFLMGGIVLAGALFYLLAVAFGPRSQGGAEPAPVGVAQPTAASAAAPRSVAPKAGIAPAGEPRAGTAPAPGGLGTPPPVRYTGRPQSATGAQAPSENLPAATILTAEEHRVLARMYMERWRDGSPLTRKASLSIDTYSGVGIMTLRPPASSSVADLEQDVLRSAFRAALRTMRTESAMRTLVIRCASPVSADSGGDEDVVFFRATATRERLQPWLTNNARTEPTADEIRAGVLADLWWDRNTMRRYLQSGSAPRSGSRESTSTTPARPAPITVPPR